MLIAQAQQLSVCLCQRRRHSNRCGNKRNRRRLIDAGITVCYAFHALYKPTGYKTPLPNRGRCSQCSQHCLPIGLWLFFSASRPDVGSIWPFAFSGSFRPKRSGGRASNQFQSPICIQLATHARHKSTTQTNCTEQQFMLFFVVTTSGHKQPLPKMGIITAMRQHPGQAMM